MPGSVAADFLKNLEELVSAGAESMDAGESFTEFWMGGAGARRGSFEGSRGVTFDTRHSTKGLSCTTCFLTGTGWKTELPAQAAITEGKGIEEERRLVDVGIGDAASAEDAAAEDRSVTGECLERAQEERASLALRVLAEIPSELVEECAWGDGEISGRRGGMSRTRNISTARRSLHGGAGDFSAGDACSTAAGRGSKTYSFAVRRFEDERAGRSDAWAHKVRHPEYGVGKGGALSRGWTTGGARVSSRAAGPKKLLRGMRSCSRSEEFST